MSRRIVLLKSHFNDQGGLEKYAKRIALALASRNDQITILTSSNITNLPQNNNITSVRTKLLPWPSFLRLELYDKFCQRWLQSNRADIVLSFDRNSNQTHIRAGNGVHRAYLESRCQIEGKLKGTTRFFNPSHYKMLNLEKKGFENPNLQKLFTNSYMVKEQILKYYNVDIEKIEVIHNGVEWEEMKGDFENWEQEKEEIRKNLKLPNTFHFLFIGNGYLRKGLKILLNALAKIKNRDFHLSIVGKETKIEHFVSWAKYLGLQKQVSFFGRRKDIRNFYKFADVLVIPSFYDPFANVTIEAMAMGLFVISSQSNGAYEIMTKDNGIVVEDLLNMDALIHALELALQHPKTKKSAESIRKSIAYLDFSKQLNYLVNSIL